MSGVHDSFLDLIAAEALGTLDQTDRGLLDAHLVSGCSECEASRIEYSAIVVLFAASAPPALPDPALKLRVLGLARGPQTHESRPALIELEPRRRGRALPWSLAALAACLTVTTVTGWTRVSRLRDQLGLSQVRLTELEQRLSEERNWALLVGSSAVRLVRLEPTADGSAELKAQALYEPEAARAVLVFEHLTPPTGRDYQLWALHGSAPQSLGLIQLDAEGRAIVRLEGLSDPATLSAFAISLEPQGGAPTATAPTGPVVMVGSARV